MRRLLAMTESPFTDRHVRHEYEQYVSTDFRDYIPTKAFNVGEPFLLADAVTLPFLDNSVDRLISTCLLHHVTIPLTALRQCRAVVRPGASITIFLSCDPSLLWRTGRKNGPRQKALKHGVG